MASDRTAALPQGTHFCEFYSTDEQLVQTLVPYFTAGVQLDEFCVCVTSDPAGVEGKETQLRKAAPHLDRFLDSGQIEILDCRDWYLRGGHFDGDRVLGQWVDKEHQCLNSGFKGLRATADTAWLERKDWLEFMAYEAAVNRALPQHRITALCAYPLDAYTADDVMQVVRKHQFAMGLPTETKETEQLRRFTALLLQRYDEDRRRIADQLREVAQKAVAIRIYLESLGQSGMWPCESKFLLADCHSLCEQSLEQILTKSNLLHPAILDELGLAACLRQYIFDFRKRSGIRVDFETRSEIGRLPQEMETHLFRIAQEGLTNIALYSGSLKAIVRLERQADHVSLQIEDFGQGVPTAAEAGLGILAMQQRLQRIGGCLEIRSSNRGTTLVASVRI